jgi:prepilin-type N-terminal cleavage/methylation domain-containing protein/prepilin-type processing-associated H-X9-DG protein
MRVQRYASNCLPTSSTERSGLTLIELLVVIGIVSLLACILVPAVQAAREASRRLNCISNLRQLGTAMHAYNAVHDMFPPSQLKTRATWSSECISEHTFLLPYLEQTGLFNSVNMCFSSIEWAELPTLENRTARNTRVSVFICPSDSNQHLLNSYRFNRGRLVRSGRGSQFDGPFNIFIVPGESTVTDGLSRTAFVSERIGGSFAPGRADLRRDIKQPVGNGVHYRSDDEYIPYCLQAEAESWTSTAGRFWLYSSYTDTHYNHNGGPNDPRPTCTAFIAHDNGFGLHPPRSFHPGLVNVLFGDGHVEGVSDAIAETVWRALGTPNRGD